MCLIYHPTPQRQLLAPCCFDTDYKRSVQDTLNQMTGAVESSAQVFDSNGQYAIELLRQTGSLQRAALIEGG